VLASLFARLALVVACASIACRPPPEPAAPKPNVLLVTIETLRADHVGSHGYGRNTTPNLDRLAREGARFENAVAQAPFTLPSIASLMTGMTPPRHGVRNHPAVLADSIETLAERFQNAGVVNYPNHQEYTRITEFKQLYLQEHRATTIGYEYGSEEGPPCYPVPTPANHALYTRYKTEADRLEDTHFVGRLAQYRYLNMDEVVEQALTVFQEIQERA